MSIDDVATKPIPIFPVGFWFTTCTVNAFSMYYHFLEDRNTLGYFHLVGMLATTVPLYRYLKPATPSVSPTVKDETLLDKLHEYTFFMGVELLSASAIISGALALAYFSRSK